MSGHVVARSARAEQRDHGATVAARHAVARSTRWPEVARAHLAAEPECRACKPGGSRRWRVQVHHIVPFHYCVLLGRSDLELDRRNLITLCGDEAGEGAPDHHLLLGHAGDFRSANLRARSDAVRRFHGWAAKRILADKLWSARAAARLEPWDRMSASEKRELRAWVEARWPRP